MPPEVSDEEKKELGTWFAGMLWEHNYKRWPEHKDTVRCMCKNAFPKVRDVEWLRRSEDIEHILESHLMLEQQWEHFVLRQTPTRIATADLDLLSSVTELESRSRTNSEAGDEGYEEADDIDV